MKIKCQNEWLELLPERALFWPAKRSVVIADPHFGKPATFRKAGLSVPEEMTAADLDRLSAVVAFTGAVRLVVLGDFFHASAGRGEATMEALHDWCSRHSALSVLLISGNHDLQSGKPPACWNFQVEGDEWCEGPFCFRHMPGKKSGKYVLAGHLHPCLSLRERYGPSLRLACFWFGRHGAVLPAFGSFTGSHPIRPLRGDRVFGVGPSGVIELRTGREPEVLR